MSEMDKLKYWMDTELTLLHIGVYVIIGLLIKSTIAWVILGILIFRSMVYVLARLAVLPKDYISVKGVKSERNK